MYSKDIRIFKYFLWYSYSKIESLESDYASIS